MLLIVSPNGLLSLSPNTCNLIFGATTHWNGVSILENKKNKKKKFGRGYVEVKY